MDKTSQNVWALRQTANQLVSIIPTKTTVYCVNIPVWKFLSFCGRCDQRICCITNDSLCCLTCTFLKLWWQYIFFYTKVWTLLFWSAHFKAHFWRRDVKWIIEIVCFCGQCINHVRISVIAAYEWLFIWKVSNECAIYTDVFSGVELHNLFLPLCNIGIWM